MRRFGLAVLIALVLELTLCQYASYMTLFNQPDGSLPVTVYGEGVQNGDGSFTAEGTLKLQVKDIDRRVNAVKLKFTRTNAEGGEIRSVTTVSAYARDEANEDYFVMPDRQILQDVPKSSYMKLHLSGNCKSLVFIFAIPQGDTVRIDELVINPRIPFSFSWLRFGIMTLALLFLMFAGARRRYYDILWNPGDRVQRRVTLAVIALQIGLFTGAVFLNPAFVKAEWKHHMQYHELAVAISRGQLFLEEQPPGYLASMENPYDYAMREKLKESAGEDYLWDTAYYNQKYYVYFGVLPVVLFYLPWYLVTGNAFPTWLGILVTGIVFIFAVFRLSGSLVRRYFHGKVPFIGRLLATILMINGCGALLMMRRPDFYSLPVLLGVTLSVLGIGFWISSLEEGQVRAWKLVAGCLCMALVAACRPQLLLGSLLIFPVYWDAVFRKRQLFSRESAGRTSLAVLAYLGVAALLMVYNDKRFGSPFDFGAVYNLTTNDMTRRGIDPGRFPQAIFIYLLQLPNISARFPYLQETSRWSSYMGKVISEGTFGGFLPVNLMTAAGLWMMWKKKWFSGRMLQIMAVMAAGLGLLVICIDAQVAGVLLRYFADFGWLFYLSALIVWFAAWEYNYGIRDRILLLRWGQNIAFAAGMAFWLLLLFTDNEYRLADTNPSLFYSFYYQLAFWT